MTYDEAVQIIEQQYTDSLGLIVQKNGDGGDSASRIGIFYYLRRITEGYSLPLAKNFDNALSKIEVSPGTYIRHPAQPTFPNETYTSDPKEFSRDQTVPLIVAMGAYSSQFDRLHELETTQFSRPFFVFQNGDLFGPMEWNAYIRSLRITYMYPIVLLCDTALLFNAITRVIKRKLNPNDTSDDVVLSLLFIQAYDRISTPISWLARQVYKLSKPMQALESYFSDSSGAPPMAEIYRPMMNKIGFK